MSCSQVGPGTHYKFLQKLHEDLSSGMYYELQEHECDDDIRSFDMKNLVVCPKCFRGQISEKRLSTLAKPMSHEVCAPRDPSKVDHGSL